MKAKNQRPKSYLDLVPFIVFVVFLSGCASVSVSDIQNTGPGPKTLPRNIYVEEFDAPDAVLRVDRTGDALHYFAMQLRSTLASGTVVRLCKYVAPAQILVSSMATPTDGWLVRGHFTRVNQGSRVLRMLIGLGAGGTKMETEVEVYDLSLPNAKPFLHFSTTGGSNAEPGGIWGWDPFSAPEVIMIGAASVLGHGLSEDASRTAREITAAIYEYAVAQGMLPPQHEINTKKVKK